MVTRRLQAIVKPKTTQYKSDEANLVIELPNGEVIERTFVGKVELESVFVYIFSEKENFFKSCRSKHWNF